MNQTDQWETRRITFAEAKRRPEYSTVVSKVLLRLQDQGVTEDEFHDMPTQLQEAAWDLALDGLQEDGAEGRLFGTIRSRRKPALAGLPVAPGPRGDDDEEPTMMIDARAMKSQAMEDTVLEIAGPRSGGGGDSCEHPQRLRRLYEGCRATGAISEAIDWLKAAANAGDAVSQAELADMYANGKDVPLDLAEANRYRRMVAQASMSTIQRLPEELRRNNAEHFRLNTDEPPPPGLPESIHRVWRSANDGCSASQAHMAGRFSRGEGVKQDWAKAAYWHERAAASGLAENQYRLALMYLHGRGVTRDVARAAEWFTRAKDNPSVNDGWATEAARLIRASSALELAMILLKGEGVPTDVESAVKCLEEAERAGSRAAADELGRLYFHGKVVPRNSITAVHWFRRAAEGDEGHGPAKIHLAKCYLSGEGVKRDVGQALRWLKAAAEHPGKAGAEATYLLGFLAEKGLGGPIDASEALKWYHRAATTGYHEALPKIKQLLGQLQAAPPSAAR